MVDLILVALASSAVKALVAERAPDRSVVAEAVSQLVRAVLSASDIRDDRLRRMEAQLGRIALQPFDNPMRSGVSLLERAAREHVPLDARLRDVDDARLRFIDAAAAAPGTLGRGIATYHVAVCALALGRPDDCRAELGDAADQALHAVLEAAVSWNAPLDEFNRRLASRPASVRDRLVEFALGTDATTSAQAARNEAERDLGDHLCRTIDFLKAIQVTRRAIGAAEEATGVPVAARRNPGARAVDIVISARRACALDGLTVELLSVERAVLRPGAVDIQLALACTGLAQLQIRSCPRDGEHIGQLPQALGPLEQGLFRRSPLLATGDLTLVGGESTQGWVRLLLVTDHPMVEIIRTYPPVQGAPEWASWMRPVLRIQLSPSHGSGFGFPFGPVR